MSEISVMDDLMKFYFWEFLSAYCVLAIAIIITWAAHKNKDLFKWAFVITFLCGLAMFGKSLYSGVLADNGANTLPFTQLWIIDFSLLGLWIYQLFAMIKYKNKREHL